MEKIYDENVYKAKVIFDGQMFDAYEFVAKLVRSAEESIILIDKRIDETTLSYLINKRPKAKVLLLTQKVGKRLNLAIQKENEKNNCYVVKLFTFCQDTFLIIDGKRIYHLGASLNQLGKMWLSFIRTDKVSVEPLVIAAEKRMDPDAPVRKPRYY